MKAHRGPMSVIVVLIAALLLVPAPFAWDTATGTETFVELIYAGAVKCPGGYEPTGNPFQPCPAGSRAQVRGRLAQFRDESLDPRLTGDDYVTANANLDTAGLGPIWGTFRLVLDAGGVWEGSWAGKITPTGAKIQATAHGSGGTVDGLTSKWTLSSTANPLVSEFTVRFVGPSED